MIRRARIAVAATVVAALLAGCAGVATGGRAGSSDDRAGAGAGPGVKIVRGDDWSVPSWVTPAANSGFFSEEGSPKHHVDTHSVDVTWRQLQPSDGAPIDGTTHGGAEQMSFDGLDAQLDRKGDFWMRIFASATTWAPKWVAKDCGVTSYGPDYDGQRHLPIWNECVWGHLMDTYRQVFVTDGLAADPRLKMVYVPGAFTWSEFDYDMIAAAVKAGDLTWPQYKSWYDHAWTDLATLFGEHADKLVFTGEDYPFGPFGDKEDLLAKQAVDAGLGIRTGITELSNFHLSEAPAYGSRIQPDGHMVVDESLPVHDGTRIVATENECFTDCGYKTDDPYYAVRQANLKALQLRMNWMYVVPGPSYLAKYPAQWNWVRMSLGQTASTSADAWADLRDAEDTYWDDAGSARFPDRAAWRSRPYVRNLERWLVQVDAKGSVAHRTTADVHKRVFEKDNGTAYEGLSTKVASGDTGFAFDVDPRFAAAAGHGAVQLKVTYLDRGDGAFRVTTAAGASPSVSRTGDGTWKTATVPLPAGALGSGSAGGDHRIRIALAKGADDLVVRFVRVVRSR